MVKEANTTYAEDKNIHIFLWSSPGFDESMAGVDNMVHLQVDGRVHDCHDQALLQRQTRRVHELQQDGKTLGVYFWVQTDGVKAAFVGIGEDGVEQPTVTARG